MCSRPSLLPRTQSKYSIACGMLGSSSEFPIRDLISDPTRTKYRDATVVLSKRFVISKNWGKS
jgi:hypothetical protein